MYTITNNQFYIDGAEQSLRTAIELDPTCRKLAHALLPERFPSVTPSPPAEPVPPTPEQSPPARVLVPGDELTLSLKVGNAKKKYVAAGTSKDLEALLAASQKGNEAEIDRMIRDGRLYVAESQTHRVRVVSVLSGGTASVKVEADSDGGRQRLPFRKTHSLGVTYSAPTLIVPTDWLTQSKTRFTQSG
jgi:hypothetical protein